MKKAVGLDIRKDGWTAVELKLTGKKPEVTAVTGGEWDLAADPAARGKLLHRVFNGYGISKRKIISSLPSTAVHWGRREFPALPPSSLQAAVHTNLETEVPWPEEKWVFSFREWKTDGQGVEVESFAYPKQVVDAQLLMLKTASLKSPYFLPRAYAIINSFLFYHRDLPVFPDKTFFIETTPAATEIFLLGRQGIIHLRSFPNPLNSEGAYDLKALAEELKLTRFLLRKTLPGEYPKDCYLLGFRDLDQDSSALIAAHLGIAKEQVRPFPLPFPRWREVDYDYPGFYSAAGLALEGLGLVRSDLALFPSPSDKAAGTSILWASVLLAAGLLLALGGVILRYDLLRKEEAFLNSWLQENQEKTVEIRQLLDEQLKLEEKLAYYSGLQRKQLVFLDFLAEWERVVPPKTIITTLVMEGSQITRLSGHTPSFTGLYQAVLNSPSLKNLQVSEGITVNQEGMEVFTLSGPLGGENSFD